MSLLERGADDGETLTRAAADVRPEPSLVILPGSAPLRQYCRDVWHHRDMLKVLGRRQILLRYRQTALGAVWVVLQPLLSAGILAFVFGEVAELPTQGVPTFIFTYTGMLAWTCFSGSFTRSQGSMVSNASLVAKIFFPRVILPLSNVLGILVDFAVTLLVLIVMLYTNDLPLDWTALALPVWVALLLAMGVGLGAVLASVVVRYRDFNYLTPLIVQFGLYASPVAYAVSAVPERFRDLYYLNPIVAPLEGFRWSLNGTPAPTAAHLTYSVAVAVVVFVGGLLIMEKMEARFADVI